MKNVSSFYSCKIEKRALHDVTVAQSIFNNIQRDASCADLFDRFVSYSLMRAIREVICNDSHERLFSATKRAKVSANGALSLSPRPYKCE